MTGRIRKHYDLIVGLGTMCSCSQALRAAELQLLSMPFDWVGGPGVLAKVRMMRDDFAGWLGSEGWTKLPDPPHATNSCWKDRWGFTPLHDFRIGVPFEDELPLVRTRYRRRIGRMNGIIDAAQRVLLVYIETPKYEKVAPGELDDARCVLNERWPDVCFEFLVLRYAEGVPFDRRTDESGNGWRFVSYDYRNRKEADWLADYAAIAKWLRREYSVTDYRTLEEREAWKGHSRKRAYAKYHVGNFLEYAFIKLQYKLYRHLRTRLERRGIAGI